jgi:GNAT superfamily N-acetyltransferase
LKHFDYQIGLYQRDQMIEVVTLLHENLWGDRKPNFSYFQWKYHDNPYAREPLGVTATHGGAVVGFRGYFATQWYIGSEERRTTILVPGDTVVHPEHRRKGLSVAMGNFAMERFASNYPVFLNMTAGKNSVPGYLRMGFAPLHDKALFRKSGLVRDAKVIWTDILKKRKKVGDVPLGKSKISFGDFGDIVVSVDPRPEEMSRLASNTPKFPAKITLLQDRDFFRWRYANAKRKYAFYPTLFAGPAANDWRAGNFAVESRR